MILDVASRFEVATEFNGRKTAVSEFTKPLSQSRSSEAPSGLILVIGLTAVIVYVLSPPPVWWFISHLPPPLNTRLQAHFATASEIVYAPLSWLYDNVPFVEDFYDRYFELLGPYP